MAKELETVLRQIFIGAFSLPNAVGLSFSPDISFIELGGSSVEAMKATQMIQQKFNINIATDTIFHHSSIRALAGALTPMLNLRDHQSGNCLLNFAFSRIPRYIRISLNAPGGFFLRKSDLSHNAL